jgi:transposase
MSNTEKIAKKSATEIGVSVIESLLKEKDAKIFEQQSKILVLENELNWFKEQFDLTRQDKFGRSTEKSEALQVELVFNEEEISESLGPQEEQQETIHYTRRKPKQCGRKVDTSKLPREIRCHDLTEAEKRCACGCQLEKIGEDRSEQVDHIPEQLKVIEHVYPKYTCRQCEIIKAVEKPHSPVPKCMATTGFIVDVIIKKYEHHLPFYRQSKIWSAQGFDIPDNTLGNWVMGAGEALLPLYDVAWQQLLVTNNLQADETPVTVLKPHKEGYLWAYHSCHPQNRFILFEFTLTRAGEHVNRRLNAYQGFLQTDGYSGYNRLRMQEGVIHFGCWDHARRKFADVVKISGQNKSGKAGEMLTIIGKLYDIEEEAKNKPYSERKLLRQKRSKPILELIYARLQKINAPSQSALGKAVQYALNQWSSLVKYIDYGEAQISNCWVENQIRPFAVGRKNWLFVGNEQSANKAALLYSLIQTCKLNHIDPRHYLTYVLNQAHKIRRKEIDPTMLLPQFINKDLF